MKKIGLIVKEASENRIKNNLKNASAFFIVKYSGLSSPDISALRQQLKVSGANLFVAKNSVARRALKDSGFDTVVKTIEGPCGLIFVSEEPIAASKALCTFSKEHEQLKLEAGFLEDKVLGQKDIEALATIPPMEVLRHQLVVLLNSPISGLAVTLNRVLAKFVYCLDQIRQKKTS
ncbi:MAG: 50S ribosomal protein L10 [Candidatus Omnitrophica bacterium]|nr:50S ribosomal protein L10 [Candidatus Omnitrophota bacterium]